MSTEFSFGPALLFCPADRPERFAKAAARADTVILDLEDAVSAAAKTAARGALIDSDLDADRVIVRVNPPSTPDFARDLATLEQTDFRTIMIAKTESARDVAAVDPRFRVIALCETARGIAHVDAIVAQGNVIGAMWGAEDLIASIGGTSSRKRNGRYRDVALYARSRVLVEAAAAGKAAIDAVYLDLEDERGLRREARDAAASGFAATACIHPAQVAIIRSAYRPDPQTLAWARAVLDAATQERGVFRFEGRMVDEPVLRHARTVVIRGDAAAN